MKKRIFAILTLAFTLALFVFPVFADEFVREDIIGEEEFSYNDSISIGSSLSVYDLYLEPGLYLVDFDWYYHDGESQDGIFYLRNIHNQTYLSYKFRDHGSETFYVYISTPCDIYFQSSGGGTSFDFSITIYTTKSYSEIYDEGYGKGQIAGYDQGYDVGVGEGEGTGYDKGYDEGYEAGEIDGYSTGYDTGHTKGYAEGKQTAQDAAYAKGKEDGWNQAIKDSDEVKTAIGGIFAGVFDGVVDSFNELTEGVTLMGLTLKQILLTIAAIGIIGICIWLFALKK